MRRYPALVALVLLLTLLPSCAGTGNGAEINAMEARAYENAVNNLTDYSLNMLAVMLQERLVAAEAFHNQRQAELVEAGDVQAAVDDEKQYQATLTAIEGQVMGELDKIAKIHADVAVARRFHEVVQKSFANADNVNIDTIISAASTLADELELDLGPFTRILKSIDEKRNLPDVSPPAMVPETL